MRFAILLLLLSPVALAASTSLQFVPVGGSTNEQRALGLVDGNVLIVGWSSATQCDTQGNCYTGPQLPALSITDYAAALNQDGSVNSATNPATPGSIVSLFVTGLNQLSANTDGVLWRLSDIRPLMESLGIEVLSLLDPVPLPVLYVGPAPGLIDGVIQINVMLPPSPLGSLPLTVRQILNTVSESNNVQVYATN